VRNGEKTPANIELSDPHAKFAADQKHARAPNALRKFGVFTLLQHLPLARFLSILSLQQTKLHQAESRHFQNARIVCAITRSSRLNSSAQF